MTMTDEMITKHSEELQKEAEALKTGGGTVYAHHRITLEFIEKLDFATAEFEWTKEEKEKIHELGHDIHAKIREFTEQALESNKNMGLLKLVSSSGDFKATLRKSDLCNCLRESLLRDLLSLEK